MWRDPTICAVYAYPMWPDTPLVINAVMLPGYLGRRGQGRGGVVPVRGLPGWACKE